MALEIRSKLSVTSCALILVSIAISAGAQAPLPDQPGPGDPAFGGPQGPGPGAPPGIRNDPLGGQPDWRVGPNGFGGQPEWRGGQNAFGGQPGWAGQPRGGGGRVGFGFGGDPNGMPPWMMNPMPNMPEMGKKMQSIMALRHINGIGLSSRDISSALPILKSMREAERTLESKSNQILDEEKRALLAAQPGAPQPGDSGERMQQAAEAFHQQTSQGWGSLTTAIGPEKAGGLRSLLEGSAMAPGDPMGPARSDMDPRAAPNFAPGQPSPSPRRTQPGGQGGPVPQGRTGNLFPTDGRPIPSRGPIPRDAAQNPLENHFPPDARPSPNGALVPPDPRENPRDGLFPPGDPNSFPESGVAGAPAGGQDRPATPARGHTQPRAGRADMTLRPGAGGQNMQPFMFGGFRISLSDLIDLLEQKQAAMRR